MAAATLVGRRRERVFGDLRVVLAQVTTSTTTDTYNTGLKQIVGLSLDCTTNATAAGTFSGGTITFANSGSPLTINVVAFGF